MVSFQVGAPEGRPLRFSVPEAGVLVAGSRGRQVPQSVCRGLVEGLGRQGFAFLVGCAPGVDWADFSRGQNLRIGETADG